MAFQEGEHPSMTPTLLLKQVEDKIRVLKHASEWSVQEHCQPSAMALISSSTPPTGLEALILKQTALIGKLLELQGKDNKRNTYNDWKHQTPANLSNIRRFNGKIFRWCTKCNGGKGQWASSHDTNTHRDNFRHDRARTPTGNNNDRGTRQGTRQGTALVAQSDSPHSDDPNASATGINQDGLTSMAANAARVRFAEWRLTGVSTSQTP